MNGDGNVHDDDDVFSDEENEDFSDDDVDIFADDDFSDEDVEAIYERLLPMIVAVAARLPFSAEEGVPRRTSSFTGAQYVEELFRQPQECDFQEALRMPYHIFMALEAWLGANTTLASSRHVDIKEKLAIFLYSVGNRSSNRALQDRFRHSGETISRIVNEVLRAMIRLSIAHVSLPAVGGPVCGTIRSNPKFYPYSEDCLGALDGILIDAHVTGWKSEAWRDHKGQLTQNALAVVDFDMEFLYVLAGWEGSAVDIRVLQDAMDTKGFSIPRGKYYLCDGDYINSGVTLCPYPDVPYHLKQQKQTAQIPANAKELFNLRHASLRNVVDRTFGALKNRFPILTHAPKYSTATQVQLVYALIGLNNFIRRHHRTEKEDIFDKVDDDDIEDYDDSNKLLFSRPSEAMDAKRDEIAEAMWADYQAALQAS